MCQEAAILLPGTIYPECRDHSGVHENVQASGIAVNVRELRNDYIPGGMFIQ